MKDHGLCPVLPVVLPRIPRKILVCTQEHGCFYLGKPGFFLVSAVFLPFFPHENPSKRRADGPRPAACLVGHRRTASAPRRAEDGPFGFGWRGFLERQAFFFFVVFGVLGCFLVRWFWRREREGLSFLL